MTQQINLFNPVFLKEKKHFSAVAMAQALGIILVGTLAMSGYRAHQLSGLAKEAAASNMQLVTVQSQWDKFKGQAGVREKSKQLEEEIRAAETEVRSLQSAQDTLQKGEFGNTKGYSDYLLAFSRQIVNGVWLTGFSIEGAGAGISLRGRTLQPDLVPLYISRLKNEKVMQGKSFSTLEMNPPPAEPVQAGATAGTTPVMRAPHAYLEFKLQSSGVTTAQNDTAGVIRK